MTEAQFFSDLVPEMELPMRWEYLKNDAPDAIAMNDIVNRIDRHLRLDSSGSSVAEFAEVTRDDTVEPLRQQYAKCVHLTKPEEVQAFIAWFNG